MWTSYRLTPISSFLAKLVRRWQHAVTGSRSAGAVTHERPLLLRRMVRLGVDGDMFARAEPDLFGNLQSLCGECERSGLCRHDLSHDPEGAGWEDYCPNAVVLHAVAELRWFHAASAPGVRR